MYQLKCLGGFLLICFCTISAYAQIKLPYTEGFESVSAATTFTNGTYALNGLSKCQYIKTDKGRLRVGANIIKAASGSYFITMDRESLGASSENHFILTLDLSDYVDSHIYVSYQVMGHGAKANNSNKVYVREDSTKTWLLVDDWHKRLTSGQWVQSDSIKLDSVLENNSQKIGAYVQLKFSQVTKDAAYNATLADGVSFDDISLTTVPNCDSKALKMGAICTGKADLVLKNVGLDVIKEGSVRWWMDNVEQKKIYFTQTIPRNGTITLQLPVGTVKSQGSDFRFEVDSVNNKADDRLNDALSLSKREGLGGSYTVGSSSSDFKTIQEAFSSMNLHGLCSPITLTLEKRQYVGRLIVPHIPGLDSLFTLTIDGLDSSATTFTHDGTNGFSTLLINSNQYITFKNCQIQTTDQKAGCCVRLTGGCNNITFESCWIDMPVLTSSGNVFGLKVSDIESRYLDEMATIRNLTVHKCLYNGGSFTNVIWADDFSWNEHIVFSDNIFRGGGIDIKTARNVILKNNKIIDFPGGFGVEEFVNLKVISNSATVANSSLYLKDGTGHILIENNALSNTLNNGGPLRLRECSGAIIRHNTVRGNPALSNYRSRNLDVRNNIFIGRNGFAISSNVENVFDVLDYNCYYSLNSIPIVAKIGGTIYYSLVAWQSARPELNQHSIERNPPVISSTNFLLKNESFLRGEYLDVFKDIHGVDRCKIAPSVGAYESPFIGSQPNAGFSLPSSLIANGVYELKSDLSEIHLATWKVNGKVVASTERFELQLSELGKYEIGLVVETCGGKDSITQLVEVIKVKAKPQADFVVTPSEIWKMDTVAFENQTKQGASTYTWQVLPQTVGGEATYEFINGTDSSSVNPELAFLKAGDFTVCLRAENSLGDDEKCIQRAVVVNDLQLMCGVETHSTASKGRLYDPGGPLGDYSQDIRYECDFAVLTCTKDLKVTFLDFDLEKGKDRLRVYDGKDNKGDRIYRYTGIYSFGLTGDMTEPKFRDTLFAPSGNLFFEFTTTSSQSARGFEIEWSGTPFRPEKPLANFRMPDSVCVDVPLAIENLSQGVGNNYQWTIKSQVSNDIKVLDSSITHTFFFVGKYQVELVVKNCGGSDTLLKEIVVIEPYGKSKAAYTVDVERPTINQIVKFKDISQLNNVTCHTSVWWDIEPKATASYGVTDQRYFEVYLRDTGCYQLTQVVRNIYGFDTLVNPCAVRVIPICEPEINAGINGEFGFEDITVNGKTRRLSFNNKYLVLKSGVLQTLEVGAKSKMIIRRRTSSKPSVIAAWIDYNQDGDFDDIDETLYIGGKNQMTEDAFDFKVRRNVLLGATTLRIAIMDTSSNPLPCGNVEQAQFIDFRVNIVSDQTGPNIALIGERDTSIHICEKWTDPGATATDNVDIGPVTVQVFGVVKDGVEGSYLLEYIAEDSTGNRSMVTRIVHVVSGAVPPVISLIGPDTLEMDVHHSFIDPGALATHVCEGIVTYKVISEIDTSKLGLYKVSYITSTSEGYKDTVERYVEVLDREAPTIALIGSPIVTMDQWDKYVDLGYSVTDNYWDSTGIMVEVIWDSKASEKPGTYAVEYVATDSSGNISSTIKRAVIVVASSMREGGTDLVVELYPNPNSGVFTVTSSDQRMKRIEVYSLTGKVLYESSSMFPFKSKTIDLTGLPKGMYIAIVHNSKGHLSKLFKIE